jgi:N-acetylmuramoyl-L-alanine amidase
MTAKFALRTICLTVLWLFYQNFNASCGNYSFYHFDAQINEANALIETQSSGKGTKPIVMAPTPPYKIKKVVLDAGHGGKDPGCVGVAKTYEKHNALAIVLRLGEYIKANFPDIEVIYTRETDVFVELHERAAIANRNNADLFISVHCNALSVSSAHGTETYVMGLHRAADNLEVAKRENASIYLEENYEKNYEGYDPDSPEAHIMSSMWQSAYLEQSILLANFVQQFSNSEAGRENRGVKQAGFIVLRETTMPSVLVEAGYLTNSNEESFLLSNDGRDKMAFSIYKAFESYKNKMEGSAKTSSGTTVNAPKKKPNTAAEKPKTEKTETIIASKQKPEPNGKVVKTEAPSSKVNSIPPPCRILLVSSATRLPRNTGKLALVSDVNEELANGAYHYYTGAFKTRKEAEKLLPDLKSLGFERATIK